MICLTYIRLEKCLKITSFKFKHKSYISLCKLYCKYLTKKIDERNDYHRSSIF